MTRVGKVDRDEEFCRQSSQPASPPSIPVALILLAASSMNALTSGERCRLLG